jgi:Leucine-rich repeat (LRR) protein
LLNGKGFFLTRRGCNCRSGKGQFSKHDLGVIPMQLLDMTNLYDVDLSFNNLAVVPRQIARLSKLRVLNLKDNLLNNVPIELSHCQVYMCIVYWN